MLRELARWFGLHLPHAVLSPLLGLTVVTFLHELAHCAAALLQGGRVVEFSVVPTAAHLGYMRYEVPGHVGFFSRHLVSGAPYLLWVAMALAVAAIALLPRQRLHPAFASTLFVWAYCVPVGDILWNLGRGDLWLPGVDGLVVTGLGAALVSAFWVAAYPVQRRLYGEWALSLRSFAALSGVLWLSLGLLL